MSFSIIVSSATSDPFYQEKTQLSNVPHTKTTVLIRTVLKIMIFEDILREFLLVSEQSLESVICNLIAQEAFGVVTLWNN